MKNLVVACTNLKNEIDMIIKEMKDDINLIYVDSKYHNNPKQLHIELQNIIDENSKYENIVFLYGQCGNSVIGLKSKHSKIIFPRVSDCISLYLGGNEKRASLYRSERSYFFTKTYLENENSMYNELQIMKKKYGEKKALKMYRTLMCNYEFIRVIKTPAYDLEDIMGKINELCEDLNLKYEVIESDLSIVKKAIEGEVDDDFIVKDEEEQLKDEDFYELGNYTQG